jgi:hypothetical protein
MATISRSDFEINTALPGARSTKDEHLLELCALHHELEQEISALWACHTAALQRTLEAIGDYPDQGDDEQKRQWRTLYRHSDAWLTEEKHQSACDRQSATMKTVVSLPAHSLTGVAVKIDLWKRTDDSYLGGNTFLWESLADDIERLAGVPVAGAKTPRPRSGVKMAAAAP